MGEKKKEFFHVCNQGHVKCRNYVKVDKETYKFWHFVQGEHFSRANNKHLENYAFDWDDDCRAEIRQVLRDKCESSRDKKEFKEKFDFAKENGFGEFENTVFRGSGCQEFKILKGHWQDEQELILNSRKFRNELKHHNSNPSLLSEHHRGFRAENCEKDLKFGNIDLFEFCQKNIVEKTTKFDPQLDENEEFFIIELCREERGRFGDYLVEVDAGEFDLMKLKIIRTKFWGGDYFIKSVEYDGKEIEGNTGRNEGKGDYADYAFFWTNTKE
tara:strand:- start:699 stop:1511 length:813 start_codon:yes stop_codon:yes gene_type:complete